MTSSIDINFGKLFQFDHPKINSPKRTNILSTVTRYITRSISSRADELVIQAKELSALNVVASKLSNSLVLAKGGALFPSIDSSPT